MKNRISYLALVISIILLLMTIYDVVSLNLTTGDNYVLNDSTKLSAVLLLPVIVLVFLKKKIWKVVFLLLIGLSYTEYVSFSSKDYALGLMSVSISLIPTALLLLHVFLNTDMLDSFKKNGQSEG